MPLDRHVCREYRKLLSKTAFENLALCTMWASTARIVLFTPSTKCYTIILEYFACDRLHLRSVGEFATAQVRFKL